MTPPITHPRTPAVVRADLARHDARIAEERAALHALGRALVSSWRCCCEPCRWAGWRYRQAMARHARWLASMERARTYLVAELEEVEQGTDGQVRQPMTTAPQQITPNRKR